MLLRRDHQLDSISAQTYKAVRLSPELQRIKELFPCEVVMDLCTEFYHPSLGKPSEDPVLLTKMMFLSFYADVKGDRNTLDTLANRLDWLQFCDVPLTAELPHRTTLVTFRRNLGLTVIEGLFKDFLSRLVSQKRVDSSHRFFDGTPAKARARINPYRDEMYEEPLSVIDERVEADTQAHQVKIDAALNTTPVQLEKDVYSSDLSAVDCRRAQEMKPVGKRQSAGDADARFQCGKHGKPSELGYEIFFTTDSKELFIVDLDVSSKASQAQTLFFEKLEDSAAGQTWSVDAECATGEILKKAAEKGITLNTPPRPVHGRGGFFPKKEFSYDAAGDRYTCPAGEPLSYRSTNKNTESRKYQASGETCHACPLREKCTSAKDGRSISRSVHEEVLEANREHAKTPEGVVGKVLRGIIAEGKFAEAVRYGLKIMRYVGEKMANMQSG